MPSATEQVCVEYCFLIIKLNSKSSKNDQTLRNLNAMCDVELILGLTCIFPLLQCVHMFIKIVQGRDVFVCDFAKSIKQAQQELYRLYCDPYIKFDDLTINDFNVIEMFTNDVLPMSWFSNLNGLEDTMYLAFLLLSTSTFYTNTNFLMLKSHNLSQGRLSN
jgi:hypothetical protein